MMISTVPPVTNPSNQIKRELLSPLTTEEKNSGVSNSVILQDKLQFICLVWVEDLPQTHDSSKFH